MAEAIKISNPTELANRFTPAKGQIDFHCNGYETSAFVE